MDKGWTDITGQPTERALGDGWRDAVHPSDLEAWFGIYKAALKAKSSFAIQYRLRTRAKDYLWVTGGAVPSFGPPGEQFIGYLGSIAIIDEKNKPLCAGGQLGRFQLPNAKYSHAPPSPLQQVADHLLIAHALVQEDGGRSILAPLRDAMLRTALELVHHEQEQEHLVH